RPDEAPRERVARSGGIDDGPDRIRRAAEVLVAALQKRAVLPLFYHNRLGAEGEDRAGGLVRQRFPGDLARLFLVDDQHANPAENPEQLRPLALDPVIHRVRENELRLLELIQNVPLQYRIDVGEEDGLERAGLAGQLGLESLEDVQLGAERFPRVHIVAIDALPAEGLPLAHLEAAQVELGLLQGRAGLGGKVLPDD